MTTQDIYDFDDLLKVIRLNDAQYDVEKIRRAYAVAAEAHAGQVRDSGEPYISHPVSVAMILADLGMDSDTLVAALLHDVVEDTDVGLESLRKEFGDDTALLVDGVTKLRKLPFSSKEEQQAENIRKMLMAIAKDVRVIIIKLADRLHNMRTIGVRPPQKQRDTALETMEVYAPIAHRLGIHAIKEELEDISLRYLDPIAYEEIESQMDLKKEERQRFIERIKAKINARLSEKYDDIFIEGRVKGVFGIYRKMYVQGRSFDEIYDIYAIRILVNTIDECYHIFGEIHDMFRPIPNRFKDYISTPKANMYQSLHTTVFDKEAIPFEVQIRTWDMHHTAEFGIAAHWKYKEGLEKKDSLEDKISWVRQLLETQRETVDTQEILGSIKSDLSTDEVFIFTPKGDVITLPAGSTIIDFAYAIHSEIGNRMVGAKVDGRMVSLDTQLQTGNIVNIITTNAKDHGPSRDWISIVKTASARNKIRGWFKRERKEENIAQGKAELEKEFRRYNILLDDDTMEEFLGRIVKNQRLNSVREFLAAIGYGGILLSKVMPRIKELYVRHYKTTGEEQVKKQLVRSTAQKQRKASSGVIVEGLEGCLVKYSKCCNPLPGDDIIGYITRGFGVSIHKKDCINVEATMNDPNQSERWVHCEWASSAGSEVFKSTIDIFGKDRDGLLLDVSIALNNMHVPVYSLIAREQPDDQTAIQITLGITDLSQLQYVSSTLGKIGGITRVERTVQ
ncbi:bifunctional (p)ppGpp synthetase/guanosine-3',5'-bis(diphosphate) 3'-pyrophosphohydrolase [Ruminococcaceae bacterium OttesenSCG-928-L11]|nr:bifunctional (p)ppGpp synthetase/guanosine-3',5'-bis(diphosphate) 3'-pyrophosphohydrolase [Ruminococcaceae bacterium OttesenSCG-928-L11]